MSNRKSADIDVAVIGGGPAGLSAAVELKRLGIARVIVLEREAEAGGIPRHCGHPPFGMREFRRILTGPQYAKRLVLCARKAGVEIRTSTTVVEARRGANLLLTSDRGVEEMIAKRVIYATGVREMPRSARLIAGARVSGIINTGALQSMVYLKDRKPFERPVIIGTELVSFSAIMTCRHAGIKPVAMIEESGRVTARWPSGLFAPMVGVPLHLKTRLVAIRGESCVREVEVVDASGNHRTIECDGVILTGDFIPETALARCGHLHVDIASGGLVVDQYGRCSDPTYFATGNILRPVETAGWSWNEGRRVAQWLAEDLVGKLAEPEAEIQILNPDPLIKYAMPQKISLPLTSSGMKNLQLRITRSLNGTLVAHSEGKPVWQKKLNSHRERRILVPIASLVGNGEAGEITLKIEESNLSR